MQFGSLSVVVLVWSLYRAQDSEGGWLWTGLAVYATAMILPAADGPIYDAFRVVSGHTLKHLVAAAAVARIV